MAQSTQGIKVGYSNSASGKWTYFPDLTGFPSLAGSNTTIDVTTLNETTNKIYLKGLADLGGTLEFPGFLTTELFTAVQEARTAQASTGYVYICIEFPAPFARRAFFKGEVYQLTPDDGSVDSAVTASLRVTPMSDIEWQGIAE